MYIEYIISRNSHHWIIAPARTYRKSAVPLPTHWWNSSEVCRLSSSAVSFARYNTPRSTPSMHALTFLPNTDRERGSRRFPTFPSKIRRSVQQPRGSLQQLLHGGVISPNTTLSVQIHNRCHPVATLAPTSHCPIEM